MIAIYKKIDKAPEVFNETNLKFPVLLFNLLSPGILEDEN